MSHRRRHETTPEHRPAGLRVAMALYGDITHDSRVIREGETLAQAGHTVTIFCLSGTPPEDAPFRTVVRAPSRSSVLPDGTSPFLGARPPSVWGRIRGRVRWIIGYAQNIRAWGRWVAEAAGEVDVWHAHDLTGLMAVGPTVKSPCRLVYDSHEIFLETGSAARLPWPFRRLLSWVEGRLARRAEALMTVNETDAVFLERRLRPRRTIVVRNCPPRWTPSDPPPTRLHDAAGVPVGVPLVLYHGAFQAHRGIEELAEAMLVAGLEDAHVVYLGFGVRRPAIDRLVADPRFGGRVHVIDPVPPDELLEMVTGAEIDAIPLQHSTTNHWLSTPNKLFESLAAGVPVVVSDFPAMHKVVCDDPSGPLGEVCDPADPASIGEAIRSILSLDPARRQALRSRCLAAAHERWNWETESVALLALYAGFVGVGGSIG